MDELQVELWATIKNARDAAANRLHTAQADLEQMNSLLGRMKDAGMDSHLPTLEELQRAWREGMGKASDV